jgi:methionine-rich copper-binding protein CopC
MRLMATAACLVATIAVAPAVLAQSKTVQLITAEESGLAAAPQGDLTFRAGISRGPSITVVSPKANEATVRSPFRLQLKFEGRGGAQVDAESVKLTYAKSPAVDLTARVKPFASASGIDLPEASVPPGQHTIRAEVKDKDGRPGVVTFVLKVAN